MTKDTTIIAVLILLSIACLLLYFTKKKRFFILALLIAIIGIGLFVEVSIYTDVSLKFNKEYSQVINNDIKEIVAKKANEMNNEDLSIEINNYLRNYSSPINFITIKNVSTTITDDDQGNKTVLYSYDFYWLFNYEPIKRIINIT